MRTSTPVLLIIFRRAELARQAMASIRAARPARLYIAADGPREGRMGEADECIDCRSAVEEMIDWPCEVFLNYSSKNLGVAWRPISAISWVFSSEERAIIVEEDCVLEPSFFAFAGEILDRFADDRRVMQVNAMSCRDQVVGMDASYYFTRYSHTWGWATWRRAWSEYDPRLSDWWKMRFSPAFRGKFLNRAERCYFFRYFGRAHREFPALKAWDYGWFYTCFKKGVCVAPAVNMVSNVGFGPDATNTLEVNASARMAVDAMSEALTHPPRGEYKIYPEIERRTFYHYVSPWNPSLLTLLRLCPELVVRRLRKMWQLHKEKRRLRSGW